MDLDLHHFSAYLRTNTQELQIGRHTNFNFTAQSHCKMSDSSQSNEDIEREAQPSVSTVRIPSRSIPLHHDGLHPEAATIPSASTPPPNLPSRRPTAPSDILYNIISRLPYLRNINDFAQQSRAHHDIILEYFHVTRLEHIPIPMGSNPRQLTYTSRQGEGFCMLFIWRGPDTWRLCFQYDYFRALPFGLWLPEHSGELGSWGWEDGSGDDPDERGGVKARKRVNGC